MYATRASMMGRGDGYGGNAYTLRSTMPMNKHMTGVQQRNANKTGTHRAGYCFVGCTGFFGPMLLIAGIVLLTYPNDRAELVRTYNTQASHFNASGVFSWSENDRGRIGNAVTQTVYETVRSEGDETDVHDFTSYAAAASFPFDDLIPDDAEDDSTIVRFELNSVIPFGWASPQDTRASSIQSIRASMQKWKTGQVSSKHTTRSATSSRKPPKTKKDQAKKKRIRTMLSSVEIEDEPETNRGV